MRDAEPSSYGELFISRLICDIKFLSPEAFRARGAGLEVRRMWSAVQRMWNKSVNDNCLCKIREANEGTSSTKSAMRERFQFWIMNEQDAPGVRWRCVTISSENEEEIVVDAFGLIGARVWTWAASLVECYGNATDPTPHRVSHDFCSVTANNHANFLI